MAPELGPDRGKITDAHPEWVHHVEVDHPHPPDVYIWQDYEAALSSPPST